MKGLTFMHWSKREVPVGKRFKAGAVVVGLAWSLSAALATCAVMFAWVVLSAGTVYPFSAFVAAGSVLGAFLGGAVSGRVAGTLGFVHGFLAGAVYGLLLSALLLAGSPEGFSPLDLSLRAGLLGLAGAVGGFFGVNLQPVGRAGWGKPVPKRRFLKKPQGF